MPVRVRVEIPEEACCYVRSCLVIWGSEESRQIGRNWPVMLDRTSANKGIFRAAVLSAFSVVMTY